MNNKKMLGQQTLRNEIRAKGITLHGGDPVEMTIGPAPVDTGIIFERIDCEPNVVIPARSAYVGDTTLSTTLVKGVVKIATVEHLLSAFAGLGIDNAHVKLTGSEVPIMDGSSSAFVWLIQSAGIKKQPVPKKFVRIKKPIRVEDGDKWATLMPYEGFKISFTIAYDHPLFINGLQQVAFDFSTTSYTNEVSRARTFGFLAEYEMLRAMNLARGGSLDNAVVIDEYRVLNENGLRYKDEFVRHKILDAIGDLYLLGHGLIGAFEGYKAGHTLNNRLLNALLKDQSAWEYVSFEDEAVTSFITNMYPASLSFDSANLA